MKKKNKLLLISSRLPYPPIGGDKLKSYNLLKILSSHFDVHLVIITDEILIKEAELELKKYTKSIKVFRKRKYRFYINLLKFLFNFLPLQVNYYYFKDVQKYINDISEDMNLAVSILVRTSEYLKNFNKKKYLDMVDSIGLNYRRSQKNVKSLFWKTVYSVETNRLLKYEEKMVRNFNATFFVNKFEAEYWSEHGKTEWIPNGVNEKLFSYNKLDSKYKNYIAFFGKMDYQPNIDAVMWFVGNVLSNLKKEIKFIVVGTKPTKEVLNLSKKYQNVEITGFVDDPYEILNSSLAIVAPMQTGGGIQNKILESMALRTINIVSSLAAKPIVGAKDKEHLLICDEPLKIANLINDIFLENSKYNNIKENAKKLIEENYTWKKYEEKLLKIAGSK